MARHIVISLGSNLGDSRAYLNFALEQLQLIPTSTVESVSEIYTTKAWGGVTDKAFLNQIIILKTKLDLKVVHKLLQSIEQSAGRERTKELRWGDRTLDLDILLVDSLVYASDELIVPHPQLHNRAFLLQILLDMGLADWVHTRFNKNIRELLEMLT